MREGLENFVKHGVPGIEANWFSADGRTVVTVYEIDDIADLHKYATFYAPTSNTLKRIW
jgi:hypothetical protein